MQHCHMCKTTLLLPLALQPTVGFGLSKKILPFFSHLSPTLSIIAKSIQLFLYSTFVTISFLLCGVVRPTPNPQPGRPGYPFLSGSSPLTCLAWEDLPVADATASIALGIMLPHKPYHYVKLGTPSGGGGVKPHLKRINFYPNGNSVVQKTDSWPNLGPWYGF
jgi:hypothetical protein